MVTVGSEPSPCQIWPDWGLPLAENATDTDRVATRVLECRYGSTIGTLRFEANVRTGTTKYGDLSKHQYAWKTLWTKSGQQHSYGSTAWSKATVKIPDDTSLPRWMIIVWAAGVPLLGTNWCKRLSMAKH